MSLDGRDRQDVRRLLLPHSYRENILTDVREEVLAASREKLVTGPGEILLTVEGKAPYRIAGKRPYRLQAAPAGKKQRPPKSTPAPKKTSPVGIIALILSIVALGLAIVAFALPYINQSATPTDTSIPKIVAADTTEATIKAGDTMGKAKIVAENAPYIVVGTSVSGDGAYSDVIYDKAKGEIILVADRAADKDSKHLVMWVACEK